MGKLMPGGRSKRKGRQDETRPLAARNGVEKREKIARSKKRDLKARRGGEEKEKTAWTAANS